MVAQNLKYWNLNWNFRLIAQGYIGHIHFHTLMYEYCCYIFAQLSHTDRSLWCRVSIARASSFISLLILWNIPPDDASRFKYCQMNIIWIGPLSRMILERHTVQSKGSVHCSRYDHVSIEYSIITNCNTAAAAVTVWRCRRRRHSFKWEEEALHQFCLSHKYKLID